ncbi:MAG: PadR family transcriptional regulator [Gemmatimonadetes bacterium]|nr:PadR family transcriptional regulator [Gemmatimonadota bacterium]
MPTDALLGTFEMVVLLAVVRLGGDGYGVTLRREIEERTGRDVALGSVYATLARLEEKGLVASHEGASTPVRGGRARRLYRVEPAGLRAVEASRRVLSRMWEGVVG